MASTPHGRSISSRLFAPDSTRGFLSASVEPPRTYDAEVIEPIVAERPRSWPFRILDACCWSAAQLVGILSVIFLLAATANIPVVQFISLGYLLEVSGRLARGGTIQDAMIGLRKASLFGGILLGTWLLLFPIRFVSVIWYEAFLIDPASSQTTIMRLLQISLITMTLVQIFAAWICGGKLRFFFWQLVAPFSFGVWIIRRSLKNSFCRRLLNLCFGWISTNFVTDICDAKPPTDWFVPAILWKKFRERSLYTGARDGLWNFVASLNLVYYFNLGFKGFIGTIAWLLIPTLLLIGATSGDGVINGFSAFFGVMIAIPVFALLPFMQAHFSTDGRLRRFFEPWKVLGNFRRAPFAHIIALLLVLVLALPLFLLKIEEIPTELLWTLSVVFIVFIWPSKIAIGLAYRRGTRKNRGRWWIRIPIMSLAMPVSFAFIFIFFFTRYISWNGAWSTLENHVFLLPAPFWL